MPMTFHEYLEAFVAAVAQNNPVGWPAYADRPVEVWRYLARGFGHGLDVYDEAQVRREVGTLYSRVLVKATFGTRLGVPVDAQTFVGWILAAMAEARADNAARPAGAPVPAHEFSGLPLFEQEVPHAIGTTI
ncbi:MAG: hypothetical protein KJ734_04485 [Chloroflexi bacterium]|nr:hypothetical protein [Chloroflexota bacterium]